MPSETFPAGELDAEAGVARGPDVCDANAFENDARNIIISYAMSSKSYSMSSKMCKNSQPFMSTDRWKVHCPYGIDSPLFGNCLSPCTVENNNVDLTMTIST